jgi:hypothetical protein
LIRAIKMHPEAFAHIRQEKKGGLSPNEWVVVAERLRQEHDVLPSAAWLLKNGYCGLRNALMAYPLLFQHIRRDKERRLPAEWVPVAKELASKHGVLPRGAWLKKNGFAGLDSCIRSHPVLFAHIKRANSQKRSAKEWVPVYKQLIREHGTLPCHAWLIKNGLGGFVAAMHTNRRLFDRTIQDKRRRLPEEWVPIAKALEREHGMLPNREWLKRNGYGALGHAMYVHPQLFSHMKQNKVSRKPIEWVPVAEQLVKKHGSLPHYLWLTKNGYGGLAQAMAHHPKLFRHIKKAKKKNGKRPEEWVLVARRLVSTHGQLPSTAWLTKNGFGALVQAVYKHRKLFKAIKRNWYK